MTTSLSTRALKRMIALMTMLLALIVIMPSAPAHATITSPEKLMMNEINAARVARGLRSLSWSSTLSDQARVHSRAMVAAGSLFHTANLAAAMSEYSWSYAGENVGRGSTVTAIFNAFQASPGHRANDLSTRYTRIGTGIAYLGSTPYVTVQFLS